MVVMMVLATFLAVGIKDIGPWVFFINAAMIAPALPLSWLRWFWWRFNVWGEVFGTWFSVPLSALIWFGLDWKSRPAWQPTLLLLGIGLAGSVLLSLLTPAESRETLRRFYLKVRPPGAWGPIRRELEAEGLIDRGPAAAGAGLGPAGGRLRDPLLLHDHLGPVHLGDAPLDGGGALLAGGPGKWLGLLRLLDSESPGVERTVRGHRTRGGSRRSGHGSGSQPVNRVALIGCGAIAECGHIPTLSRHPRLEVAAVCDTRPARAALLADQVGNVPAYADWRELLDREEVDAAVLTLPPEASPDVAIGCLQRGIHVLDEKPLAATVEDGRRVARAVVESGRVFQVGFVLRYGDLVRYVARLASAIGVPSRTRVSIHDERLDRSNVEHFKRIQGFLRNSSAMTHEGSHVIDYAALWNQSPWTQGSRGGRAYRPRLRRPQSLAGHDQPRRRIVARG